MQENLCSLSFITSSLRLCRCVSSIPGHVDVLSRSSVVCTLLRTRTYHGSAGQDGEGVPWVNNLFDHSKLNLCVFALIDLVVCSFPGNFIRKVSSIFFRELTK